MLEQELWKLSLAYAVQPSVTVVTEGHKGCGLLRISDGGWMLCCFSNMFILFTTPFETDVKCRSSLE